MSDLSNSKCHSEFSVEKGVEIRKSKSFFSEMPAFSEHLNGKISNKSVATANSNKVSGCCLEDIHEQEDLVHCTQHG